ncbi:MAG TPA: Na+/H+ antiporter NhaA, partial [Actinomycetota bacterium]|nr:Na+/H+ antiporter NhaA [Actinomycetota bacterium]
HQEMTVGGLTWDLRHWVNDALMTIFFLVIGLEVKRELTIGRLRDPRRATLPIVAALAGALVPALVFLAFNPSGPAARGWAIPMATDPAFAVGVLALLGSRVPAGAKAFLLALAVVDDIAAVTVIAVAYTSQLALGWLVLAALGVVAGGLLLRARVLPLWGGGVLGLLGAGVWWAAYRSGLHATIAGVALGFAVPARPIGGRSRLELLEGRLHLGSAYLVVPLFALANAGVVLDADALSAAWGSRVAWGVAAGLLVGKLAGVVGSSVVAMRLGWGSLPEDMTGRHLWGLGALAGIGFTVALFVTDLAYGPVPSIGVDPAKIAILAASLAAGLLGVAVLFRVRAS